MSTTSLFDILSELRGTKLTKVAQIDRVIDWAPVPPHPCDTIPAQPTARHNLRPAITYGPPKFLQTNAAPSEGRSLNSRGSSNPRILACKASQSERLTRVTDRMAPMHASLPRTPRQILADGLGNS